MARNGGFFTIAWRARRETALAGWGGRIRTSAWRNQNPRDDVDRVTYFSRLSRKATVSHQYVAGRFPTVPGRTKSKAARSWTLRELPGPRSGTAPPANGQCLQEDAGFQHLLGRVEYTARTQVCLANGQFTIGRQRKTSAPGPSHRPTPKASTPCSALQLHLRAWREACATERRQIRRHIEAKSKPDSEGGAVAVSLTTLAQVLSAGRLTAALAIGWKPPSAKAAVHGCSHMFIGQTLDSNHELFIKCLTSLALPTGIEPVFQP